MVALLMWGGWSRAEEHSIVIIFGWSLGGFIAAMIAVIVGLLAGGPVGRFKLAATRDGASIEADSAMILRLLNWPGHRRHRRFGLALAVLLVVQKGETRHWRKQSAQFEQLYQQRAGRLRRHRRQLPRRRRNRARRRPGQRRPRRRRAARHQRKDRR